jgi:hypothetical protein
VGIFIREGFSFKIRDHLSFFVEHEFESIVIEVQNEKENLPDMSRWLLSINVLLK